MSKLTNYVSKKFLIGIMFGAVLAVGFAFATPASADCSISTTLRIGSRGTEVVCLQTIVGASADGNFGPMTKAKVVAWQASHGLVTDGIFGPMSRAAWMATVSGGGSGLPAGCQPGFIYSMTTGQRCDGTTTPPPTGDTGGVLKGGAGEITLSTISTDVEDKVKEGESNAKVLGFKVKAEGSDVKLSNVKVHLQNDGFNHGDGSSENLSRYIDTVTVWMGNAKVGSAKVSEFSKNSGSPDEFTKSITLSNAIVRENKEAKFYVAVSAVSNIDTEDMDDADWNVMLETVRFNDATGAIMTEDTNNVDDTNFSFDDASTDDKVDLKTSTANPKDKTVQVEEHKKSEEYLALAFKLDVGDNSQDVMIKSLPINIAINNCNCSGADELINSVVVKVGGKEFEANLDDDNGDDNTSVYIVDWNDDEFAIDSGKESEVKVYITFNDQDNNYDENVTVKAIVNPNGIEAETENDELSVGGSTKTGAELTLRVTGADFQFGSATATTSGNNSQIGTFKIKFTAQAFGDDIQIPKAGNAAIVYEIRNASDDTTYASGTQSASFATTTGADSTNDNMDNANAFVVSDSEKFTATVTLNNASETSGQYYLVITAINFYPNDTDAITSVAVNDTFQTDPIFVGK
jgi:peptidoglycan hydrolase-like protein with peptidoglycan-binding domain